MSKEMKNLRFNTQFNVKFSLVSLYLALTFPLVFIALEGFKLLAILCLIIGLIFTFNISNDYVIINENFISLKTSFFSRIFGKNNYEIFWNDITSVKSFPTSQGSKVHYFITSSGKGYLIPQRLERYVEFKKIVENKIKCLDSNLSVISPLWTYKLLSIISTVMFIGEIYGFILSSWNL